jgi:predicted DCC family thiol-disulfide oxidoreductase YuxK
MKTHIEVLYNADCPICSREVNHYAKLSTQADLPIRYDDLGNADRLESWGVTAQEAAKRFHVRQGDTVTSGLPAFIILWRDIPQTRWLAGLFNLPGLHWIAVKVYDYLAAPLLYKMHERRQAKAAANSSTSR